MNSQIKPVDEELQRRLQALDADLQAALALSRATLHALAALSPRSKLNIDAALEDEIDRADEAGAPQQVIDSVSDGFDAGGVAAADNLDCRALQLALVRAAADLASDPPD